MIIIRKFLPLIVLIFGLSISLLAQPAVNFLSARVSLDSTGALILHINAYGGTTGPAANVANTRVKVASDGGLIASIAGGTVTPDTICLDAANQDACLVRDAADILAQRRSTNAQTLNLYRSFTDTSNYSRGFAALSGASFVLGTSGAGTGAATLTSIFTQINGVNNFKIISGTGGYTQLASSQTTAPTCTTNCGTPGNVCIGSDSDMVCTMGTTPASGFVVVFNGTWAAAPACIGQMALAGMAAGKAPLTVVSTTGQITVVTNGTAPVAGDKYSFICRGTQ